MASPLTADALLGPFGSALSHPSVRHVADSTLTWVLEGDADLRRELAPTHSEKARRRFGQVVTVAAVYAGFCAPTYATVRSVEVAARFVLLFLLVDDADLAELPDLVSDDDDWSIGRHTPLLRRWLDELPERKACRAALRDRFGQSFQDYLRARRREPDHKSDLLTLEAHWAFRRQTIFTEPFLDQWLICLGVDGLGEAEAALVAARQLATDIVLVANDLGSATRDSASGDAPDDLNLADTYARVDASTRPQAVERLIALQHELVGRFCVALESAESKTAVSSQTSGEGQYRELLTALVDGNLASLYALDFRYRGVRSILDRLHVVRPEIQRPAFTRGS